MNEHSHDPVMVSEIMAELIGNKNGIYVDGTFGRGGHSRALLEQLNDNGRLVVFDQDDQAIEMANQLSENDARVRVVHGNFTGIHQDCVKHSQDGKVDGILLDLGVSSPQLDQEQRGFSFRLDGPLDMRMDRRIETTASDWLNRADEKDIADVIWRYGEEKFSRRIAKNIVEEREKKPLETTQQLVNIIKEAVPFYERNKHPAVRTFQAIRIHINQEIMVLEQFFETVLDVLKVGGRLAILGFHSLEHKAITRFIRLHRPGNESVKDQFNIGTPKIPRLKRIIRHAVPSSQEVRQNPRARSAILRIVEKIQ